MRSWALGLMLGAIACGGGGDATADAQAEAMAARPVEDAGPVEDAPPAPTGTVYEVRMLLTPEGQYVYQPASLTIRRGDIVRWINVSGGPHNVAFHADRIPAGAAPILNTAMPNRMADLAGALLIQPNAVYEMRFAGAPVGTYDYYCTPHEMLGMRAQLTITR